MPETEYPTLPPGPEDDAALEYAREIVRDGRDRTVHFWAMTERLAEELGVVSR